MVILYHRRLFDWGFNETGRQYTIFEVETDGSAKYKTLFPTGPNQILGIALMGGKVFVAGAIMCRSVENGKYVKSKLNAWAITGKPNAIGNDGSGNLIILDGAIQKLFKLNTKNLALSVISCDLPAGYSAVGSYPPAEFPRPMAVSTKGEIYIPTLRRGTIKLQKK